MKPTIYLPVWLLKILDEQTTKKLLDAQYLSKSSIYAYTGNEFEIKIVEDDLYSNCASQFAHIYDREDKLFELEKEVKHLREIKDSVDHMRKLLKCL